ncbi:MAG TPA: M48 family metalloprotease [Myxococcaceae bacterium]|nr:M48 family metalloprotease [Myxococcaceae bacterium]
MDSTRRTLIPKAFLALGLWVGFWGLSLVIAGALFWVPFAQGTSGDGVDPLGWLAVAAGAGVLWAVRPRGWFTKKESGWAALSPEEAPRLHAFVQEVASRCGAARADEIGLEGGAGASIGIERRGLRRIRRVNIGFPLFAFLDREELSAVLAHEFGHHQGGDLLLGPWVYRTRASLAQAVDSLEGSAFFLDVPFRAYGRMFLDVSGSVSRGQELAADARSVSAYGRRAAWSALEKIHRLAPRWSVYLHAVAISVIEHGCRVPLLEGFRMFLARQTLREDLQRRVEEIEARAPTPADTHPPLGERLAAIDVHGRALAASRDDGSGCLDLLGGEQGAETLFYARATRGKLREVGWADVGRDVLAPAEVERFAEGPLALERVGPRELPRLLADWSSLAQSLSGGGPSFLSPAAERTRVHHLLERWLTAALIKRDFVPTLEPGAAMTLSRGSETVDPAVVLLALIEGRLSASEYLARCQRWDVRG